MIPITTEALRRALKGCQRRKVVPGRGRQKATEFSIRWRTPNGGGRLFSRSFQLLQKCVVVGHVVKRAKRMGLLGRTGALPRNSGVFNAGISPLSHFRVEGDKTSPNGEPDVCDLFQEFGEVEYIGMPPYELDADRNCGYAVVNLEDVAARRALAELQGKLWHGRKLRLEPACRQDGE